MSNDSSAGLGSIGLLGVIFLVFFILKLVGVIDWSWWWVTSPLWISALVGLTICGICLLAVILIGFFTE